MEIKLTNVLYNFEEFYNRCNLYLRLETNVQDELELLLESYKEVTDLSIDGTFEPEKNVELSIEIIEFLLENFHYFKNDVFDYSLEQTLAICPDLTVVNYRQIYDKLIETYSLNEEGDISLFNANIQEIDVEDEIDIENYLFTSGEVFTLKDEWKDGNEGEYYVIEDRGNKVLASPNWETGLTIIPQEIIMKSMIAEIKPYNNQVEVEIETPIDTRKDYKINNFKQKKSIPSNVLEWIKEGNGYHVEEEVKLLSNWHYKLTGRNFVGGTSIGKSPQTLILDITYQGAELYVNSETIKFKGQLIENYNDYKLVFNENFKIIK